MIREPVVAHELPDVFDRVQFRRDPRRVPCVDGPLLPRVTMESRVLPSAHSFSSWLRASLADRRPSVAVLIGHGVGWSLVGHGHGERKTPPGPIPCLSSLGGQVILAWPIPAHSPHEAYVSEMRIQLRSPWQDRGSAGVSALVP